MIRWVPALLLTLAALGCGDPHPSKGPQRPTEVSVSKVKMSQNVDYVDFTGRTEAKEMVEVKARVTGYLMKVTFDEGKLVKEGDVLYQIDDRTYKAAQVELDPVKRAAMFIRLNDLPVQDHIIIPVVARPRVRASNLKLKVPESGWDSDFWALQDWYREA